MSDPIVIVSAARTPMGGMLGDFAALSASDLGAVAVKAAVERAGLKPEQIEEVILGNCLDGWAGAGACAPGDAEGRLAERSRRADTDQMCGSGMKAVMLAHDAIVASSREVVLAGGMESMTNAPYLLAKGRQGYRYGHATVYDHMAQDGLEDAYERGKAMGVFAESCAAKYGFTREQQDAYAIDSLKRAQAAIAMAGRSGGKWHRSR